MTVDELIEVLQLYRGEYGSVRVAYSGDTYLEDINGVEVLFGSGEPIVFLRA